MRRSRHGGHPAGRQAARSSGNYGFGRRISGIRLNRNFLVNGSIVDLWLLSVFVWLVFWLSVFLISWLICCLLGLALCRRLIPWLRQRRASSIRLPALRLPTQRIRLRVGDAPALLSRRWRTHKEASSSGGIVRYILRFSAQ